MTMIELPSARNILEKIAEEEAYVVKHCATCSVHNLEHHMRKIHILTTKYLTLYANKNNDKKINW